MAIQQILSPATFSSQPATAPPRPAAPREPAADIQLPGQASPQPTREQIEQAVQVVQKAVEPVAQNLQFQVDKETGKTIISVVDSVTQEVIRQIPGEEILAIAKAIDRMKGLLVSQKA